MGCRRYPVRGGRSTSVSIGPRPYLAYPIRCGIWASHVATAGRGEFGRMIAVSNARRRSSRTRFHVLRRSGFLFALGLKTMASVSHVVPARTSSTYGRCTPVMVADGPKCCRSARRVGVAMATSPIQLGKNTATLMGPSPLHVILLINRSTRVYTRNDRFFEWQSGNILFVPANAISQRRYCSSRRS